jgi:hypothetical protein
MPYKIALNGVVVQNAKNTALPQTNMTVGVLEESCQTFAVVEVILLARLLERHC